MRMPQRLRAAAALTLAAAALGAAACGGDDEGRVEVEGTGTGTTGSTTTTPESGPPTTTTPEAKTTLEPPPEIETETESSTSPEDAPGGAGDEIPASSQARVTGNGGELSPRLIRVPPFIAIRVELRSVDGVEYDLRAAGATVSAGGEIQTASKLFDGLRPGERLVLRGGSAGNVTVEASAEPGP